MMLNERCDGRVVVADLTTAAALKLRPAHHLLLRWLSSDTPLLDQMNATNIGHLMMTMRDDEWPEFESMVKRLAGLNDNASEFKRLSEQLHREVAEALNPLVGGPRSAAVYAEYSIRALRDCYDKAELIYLSRKSAFARAMGTLLGRRRK